MFLGIVDAIYRDTKAEKQEENRHEITDRAFTEQTTKDDFAMEQKEKYTQATALEWVVDFAQRNEHLQQGLYNELYGMISVLCKNKGVRVERGSYIYHDYILKEPVVLADRQWNIVSYRVGCPLKLWNVDGEMALTFNSQLLTVVQNLLNTGVFEPEKMRCYEQ